MQGDVSNLVILQQQQVVGINALNAGGGFGASGVGVSDSADLGTQGMTGHSTGTHSHIETDPATFDKMIKNGIKRGYKVYSISDGNQTKLITSGAEALPHHLDKDGNRKSNTWDVVFEDSKGNTNVPVPSPFDGPSTITDQGNDPSGYGNYVEATESATGKKVFVGHLASPAAARGTQLHGSSQVSQGLIGGRGDNISQYLRRIAVGESGEGQNTYNPDGGATGDYQFIPSTRASIKSKYGVDAWSSDKSEQKKAAIALIKDVSPQAYEAIQRGDFATADRLLNGTWTSLPGGAEESPRWSSQADRQKYGPSGSGSIAAPSSAPVYSPAPQQTYSPPQRSVPKATEWHPSIPEPQKPHSGFGGQLRGDERSSLTVIVNQTIANRSDAEAAGKNAKEGLRAGLDHFGKDWEAQTKLKGNQARPTANAYG
jgi:hypothetical protein